MNAERESVNKKAIVSVICGLVSLALLAIGLEILSVPVAVVGVWAGTAARSEISRSGGRDGGSGLASAGFAFSAIPLLAVAAVLVLSYLVEAAFEGYRS